MPGGPHTFTELPISPRWLNSAAGLRPEFEGGDPFPLLVLDDFLDAELAEGLLEEFPAIGDMPRSRDYMFGNKHELSSVAASSPSARLFADAMVSDGFRHFLEMITGLDLFIDPDWHGGGLHQGGDGSYLDMHVDFNIHPLHDDWLRKINVLLYLNKDWDREYGGELLVKAAPDAPVRAIAPIFNRAVIMVTDERTYHGYRRMRLPDGVTRRSIATYAYTTRGASDVRARTTGWAPEAPSATKRVVARHYDTVVRWKNRLLGSGTARNR